MVGVSVDMPSSQEMQIDPLFWVMVSPNPMTIELSRPRLFQRAAKSHGMQLHDRGQA